MVIHTTVTTCGLKCEVIQSVFLSMFQNWNRQRRGWNYLREMEFAANVEGYMYGELERWSVSGMSR